MSRTAGNTMSYPSQLERTNKYVQKYAEKQPQAARAFTTLHHAAIASGALDTKTKELIALAIGVAARCDGCIAFHTNDALKSGATEAEVMDALSVAILMGGGPSLIYATHVLEALEQFKTVSAR